MAQTLITSRVANKSLLVSLSNPWSLVNNGVCKQYGQLGERDDKNYHKKHPHPGRFKESGGSTDHAQIGVKKA